MANEDNLIPITNRTTSEQREIQKKGGLASGKSRRQKADLKKAFETLLTSEINNEQMKDLLVSLGYETTNEMALAMVIFQKALQGDMAAFAQVKKILDDL